MRFSKTYGLIWILLLCGVSAPADDLGRLIEDVQSANGLLQPVRQDCGASPFSEKSCSFLFSATPPLDAQQKPVTDPNHWLPYCFENFVQADLRNTKKSRSRVVKEEPKYVESLDECGQVEGVVGASDDDDHDPGLRPMPLARRKVYEAKIHQQQLTEASLCCGSDAECLSVFKSVPVKWCNLRKGIQECADSDNYNPDSRAITDQTYKMLTNKITAADYQLVLSSVSLAPLINSDGKPFFDLVGVAHEFGHVCSSIRTQLQIKRGSVFMRDALRAEYESDADLGSACELSDRVKKRYQENFAALKATPETFNCLWDRASKLSQHRFKEGTCKNACPILGIEEAFADFASFSALSPADTTNAILQNSCDSTQDNVHILEADVMACALLTPAIREKFYTASGCAR